MPRSVCHCGSGWPADWVRASPALSGAVQRELEARRLAAAGAGNARFNDNELILFDQQRRESWICYPPRSGYDFIQRAARDAAIFERRPWQAWTTPDEHVLRPWEGCTAHGLEQAAIALGYDPFR